MACKNTKSHKIKKVTVDYDSLLADVLEEINIGISYLFMLWHKGFKCPEFSQFFILFLNKIEYLEPKLYQDFLKIIRKVNMKLLNEELTVYDITTIDKYCSDLYNMIENGTTEENTETT